MNLDEIVGDNIRGYRKKINLTQEALAGRSSLSSNFVACLERAEDTVSIRRLALIAKALKIDPHLLLIPESYKDEKK
ncbi:MAG TPA: helix-turn-helix transcriptional regulator [Candidatus Kapabacteria bacterium]